MKGDDYKSIFRPDKEKFIGSMEVVLPKEHPQKSITEFFMYLWVTSLISKGGIYEYSYGRGEKSHHTEGFQDR